MKSIDRRNFQPGQWINISNGEGILKNKLFYVVFVEKPSIMAGSDLGRAMLIGDDGKSYDHCPRVRMTGYFFHTEASFEEYTDLEAKDKIGEEAFNCVIDAARSYLANLAEYIEEYRPNVAKLNG